MLHKEQKERVDIYIKHYRVLPLEIMEVGRDTWEVYYRIATMGKERPIYMILARCKSKQAAAVKISEIEDYVVGDMEVDEIIERVLRQSGKTT